MILLHTNDLHGKLTPELAVRLRAMRDEADLWVDSGDLIKAGNLAVPLRPEQAWTLMAEAGCDIGTIGNRESHVLEAAFRAKLAGAQHRLICANLLDKSTREPVLEPTAILEVQGVRVGFVGVMVAMVTDRMASKAASAYLWEPPLPCAAKWAEALRPSVDALVAITHIGLRQDRELAASGLFDLMLGGHSHDVLDSPEQVGKTWICQGGSHARYVGRYDWDPGVGTLEGGLTALA